MQVIKGYKAMSHHDKMEAKKAERERMYKQQNEKPYIPTNLSRNHPDYGMSMEDHLKEKETRK